MTIDIKSGASQHCLTCFIKYLQNPEQLLKHSKNCSDASLYKCPRIASLEPLFRNAGFRCSLEKSIAQIRQQFELVERIGDISYDSVLQACIIVNVTTLYDNDFVVEPRTFELNFSR